MSASKKNQQNLNTGFEQQILNISSIGVLITAVSDGTILHANKMIARLLGIQDVNSIIGTPVPNFYWEPKDRQIVLERLRTEGAVKDHEVRIRQSGGRMIWVSISIQPFNLEGERVLLSEIADITVRKQAEEALQKANARAQAVLDAATQESIIATEPDGMITIFNTGAERMLGYSAEEMVGKQSPAILHLESEVVARGKELSAEFGRPIEGFDVFTEYAKQGSYEERNWMYVRKDGVHLTVSLAVTALRDSAGNITGFLGVARDITERTLAEARLQSMVENAPEAIVVIDLTTGLFTEPNENAVKLYALAREELLKVGPAEMSPPVQPDGRQSTEKAMEKINAAMQGESPVFEWVHRNARGEDIPCEIRLVRLPGNLPLVRASVTDVTERKQAEEALQKANARVQAVLDAATQESIIATEPDGMITIFNAGAERMLGYSAKEMVGKQSPAILHLESEVVARGKELSAEFGRPIEGFDVFTEYAKQGSYEERNWTYVRKDGVHLTVSLAVTVLRDSAGNITGFMGVARDITERTLADARLQSMIENAPEAIVVIDLTTGLFTEPNENAIKLYALAREELLKVGPAEMSPPVQPDGRQSTEKAMEQINAAMQGEAPVFEWVHRNARGEDIPCEVRLVRLPGNLPLVRASVTDITERKRLEQQIQTAFERRGYEVQISTEISQEIASASELSDLFGRVVTLTKERLGYYHTQLLRYDAIQDAVVLINGYGETGQKMLAGGHKLPMGIGLIGIAAASGQTILRPTLTDDPDWQPNPLLPDTQGEIAVPIKFQDKILGVLDVQSNRAGALTEGDRLVLESLCGQIAVAIEQTRLRQEMAERLEEVNRLYQSMSHEGWKTYRDTADLPAGFMFDQAGVRPVDDEFLADELFANVPMRVLGGEVVGMLTVANDPRHPTTPDDYVFLQQVSDQVALALESARLSAQTQSALAQTELLSEAGLRFARAADLQELVKIGVETLGIAQINRAVLETFTYNSENEMENIDVLANWWNGTGHEPTAIGARYTTTSLPILKFFLSSAPVFFSDAGKDERVDSVSMKLIQKLNIHAIAVLPLFHGEQQTGVLILESEEPHNFTQAEARLFSAMGPQIATVLENRRQFQQAQHQAERESTLNLISQKIQSATTVEAVLQIAARELGHALGAPMTIAQLSMKDKK